MNSKFIDEDKLLVLIEEAVSGDTSSFEIIVRSYQYYAYKVAFRVLANDDDAKDVVQECFVRIWKNIKGYNKKVKFTTWMYKIVVNLCYDKLRLYKKEMDRMEDWNDDIYACMENPETICTNNELAAIIKSVSNGLPEKQRIVFVLRDLEELTTDEVANILEISHETVKANLSYARMSIRKKLIERRRKNEV